MRSGGTRLEAREEIVLVSDIHLNEVVASEREGWWEYKSPLSAHAQDEALRDFMRSIDQRRPPWFERSVLVMNGDTFDFDTCFSAPDGVAVPDEGLPSTAAGSAWKMRRICHDHPIWVAALSAFLARGNRAIFVMGNHDRELYFAEVQALLVDALVAAAPIGQGAQVAARVAFEPWFVYRPGVLYAEHGNQYDATCSYRDVLDPSVPASGAIDEEIETPFGSLLGRHTLCRLGTFNPYNDESFILSLGGYFDHWRRYYFPKRQFFRAYFRATWGGIRELRVRGRRQHDRQRAVADPSAAHWRAYAADKQVTPAFLERQLRLSSKPVVDKMRLMLHEVWLDRFAFILAAVGILTAGILLVERWSEVLLLLMLVPAFIFVLRAMGRGSLALQERARWGLVAEAITESLDVPVVAFGHSHRPERRPLTRGGRYYNLGSWAPVLEADQGSPLARARRYLVVRPDANGRVHVVFARWGAEAEAHDAPSKLG